MKVLLYMRQERGKESVIVKRSEYEPEEVDSLVYSPASGYISEDESEIYSSGDGLDTERPAFFEAPFRPPPPSTAERLDEVVKAYKAMLPSVHRSMKFIDIAPSGAQDGDLHIYFKCVEIQEKNAVMCAFVSFEHLEDKSPVLGQVFEMIAGGVNASDEILNFGERRVMWL